MARTEAERRVLVLGLGGVLMGDDGIGPYVVRRLAARWDLEPHGVDVLDGGTPGPDLVDYLAGREAAVLVDAVRSAEAPGTVRVYRHEEIAQAPVLPRLSPHDPDLAQALVTAEMAGEPAREVVLVGVVPERVELSTELSPALRRAVPKIEAAVLGELRRLGVSPTRRRRPLVSTRGDETDIWWQRPACPTARMLAASPGSA